MEQLEKLTPEQKKLYESIMAYDLVMTNWLDAQEENRIQFKSNPIKAFFRCNWYGKRRISGYGVRQHFKWSGDCTVAAN